MTFRELCQALARECGVDRGSIDVPATVTGQTGDLRSIVDWTRQAYIELQARSSSWRWMRASFTLTTVADQDSYEPSEADDASTSAAIDRFSRWRINQNPPPRIYLASDENQSKRWLIPITWEHYQLLYQMNAQASGQPVHITVDPQNNLYLGPTPDDEYVVLGDYQRSAQRLESDSDEPEMPESYHYLIVYDAMRKYAGYEAAGEVMARAVQEGRPLLRSLERNQLPRFRAGRPLA